MGRVLFIAALAVSAACISVPPADVADTSSSGEASSSSSATTGTTTTSATSTTSGSSSGGTTVTSTTDASSTSASTNGDTTTGATEELLFIDDFERPDSLELGNGWVEKTPDAYRIEEGIVVGDDVGPSYYNSVWYRPDEEAVADIELTVRFRLNRPDTTTTPQLHARIQPDVVSLDLETAYLAYVPSSDTLRVGPVIAGALSPALESPIVPQLQTGVWYRLRLSVVGAGPVQLYGSVEEEDGPGNWSVVAEVSGTDPTPDPITAAGSFGVSGNTQLIDVDYDDFEAWVPGQ